MSFNDETKNILIMFRANLNVMSNRKLQAIIQKVVHKISHISKFCTVTKRKTCKWIKTPTN